MLLEQHLKQLSEELKLDFPAKEEPFYRLQLNPKTTISVKELAPGVYFHSPITACPKEQSESFLTLLMKANFLGQGTLGAVIGLDKEEKFLTLSLNLPYDMNYRTFRETVEDFANILDYWKDEIRHFIDAAKSQPL